MVNWNNNINYNVKLRYRIWYWYSRSRCKYVCLPLVIWLPRLRRNPEKRGQTQFGSHVSLLQLLPHHLKLNVERYEHGWEHAGLVGPMSVWYDLAECRFWCLRHDTSVAAEMGTDTPYYKSTRYMYADIVVSWLKNCSARRKTLSRHSSFTMALTQNGCFHSVLG